jgi:hypothetical protein
MMMDPHSALLAAGTVFGIVALVNAIRLSFKFDVIVGKKLIPLWWNGIGLLISLSLSVWMFLAS